MTLNVMAKEFLLKRRKMKYFMVILNMIRWMGKEGDLLLSNKIDIIMKMETHVLGLGQKDFSMVKS